MPRQYEAVLKHSEVVRVRIVRFGIVGSFAPLRGPLPRALARALQGPAALARALVTDNVSPESPTL